MNYTVGGLCVHKGAICRIEKVEPHPTGLNPILALIALFTADGHRVKNAKIRKGVAAGSVEPANKAIDSAKAEIARLNLFVSLLERGVCIDNA